MDGQWPQEHTGDPAFMLTPAPSLPAPCQALSLSPCLCLRIPLYSLLISLSTLHHCPFFLSLCLFLSLPLYLLVFCFPVFSVFLHNPHTLSTFFFPGLSPSLSLWVSGSLASGPCLQHKQHLGNRSSWARRLRDGAERRSTENRLQAATAALMGRWGHPAHAEAGDARKSHPGPVSLAREMGWGGGLEGSLQLPRGARASPGP